MKINITKEELKEKIISILRNIYDPEIPVNIYDLGLIYDIQIAEDQITEEREVVVLMTLTAPTCPVAGSMTAQVEYDIKELPEVKDCRVILTFDPPWNVEDLSDEVKLELGIL